MNLNISKAPVSTSDSKPKVRAFHVFKAISAKASGTSTAALNFSPSKKGNITFLITFEERPKKQRYRLKIIIRIGKS